MIGGLRNLRTEKARLTAEALTARVSLKVATRLVRSEYDPETGLTEEFWYAMNRTKDGPARITIRRLQDVDDILDMNRIAFNSHTGKKPNYADSNGNHHVATIPNILVEKWMREGFNWFKSTDKERRAKLNDRDYSKLLARPGKL